MDKILTIVVPTYNMEKYLDKCLTSLIVDDAGLMKKLEVLVVIDGATDRSSEIAHTYQDRLPDTFRVIDKENGNYGSCVNRGLKEAAGKYIKILDADDSFDTANFKEFLKYLLTVDVDCVISDKVKVDESGKITMSRKFNLYECNKFFPLRVLGKEAYKTDMHTLCYNTSLVKSINYCQTEGISYTDEEWSCFPMAVSKTLSYFPYVIYRYFVGRSGQTFDFRVMEKNYWQLLKVAKDMLVISYSSKELSRRDYVYMRISRLVKSIYSYYFKNFSSYKNNEILVEFDKYLRSCNLTLYREVGDTSHVAKIYYVNLWRKDYKPGRLYLNIVRRISKMEDCLRSFVYRKR